MTFRLVPISEVSQCKAHRLDATHFIPVHRVWECTLGTVKTRGQLVRLWLADEISTENFQLATEVSVMRAFKTMKDARLARFLLDFVEGELTPPQIKGACVNGFVKESVLQQYFGNPSMRKKYPKADVERVLDVLVKANLLEMYEETSR